MFGQSGIYEAFCLEDEAIWATPYCPKAIFMCVGGGPENYFIYYFGYVV
jgi:hypothetical protein